MSACIAGGERRCFFRRKCGMAFGNSCTGLVGSIEVYGLSNFKALLSLILIYGIESFRVCLVGRKGMAKEWNEQRNRMDGVIEWIFTILLTCLVALSERNESLLHDRNLIIPYIKTNINNDIQILYK